MHQQGRPLALPQMAVAHKNEGPFHCQREALVLLAGTVSSSMPREHALPWVLFQMVDVYPPTVGIIVVTSGCRDRWEQAWPLPRDRHGYIELLKWSPKVALTQKTQRFCAFMTQKAQYRFVNDVLFVIRDNWMEPNSRQRIAGTEPSQSHTCTTIGTQQCWMLNKCGISLQELSRRRAEGAHQGSDTCVCVHREDSGT